MKVVVQRSGKASVNVDQKEVSSIDHGLVLLVGFTEGDSKEQLAWMAKKIVGLRIFPDENGVMNKSLLDTKGQILSISQFTLYGNVEKGNRPSYMAAMKGEQAILLYEQFNQMLEEYVEVKVGIFGADMTIKLENIGPTTILLER